MPEYLRPENWNDGTKREQIEKMTWCGEARLLKATARQHRNLSSHLSSTTASLIAITIS